MKNDFEVIVHEFPAEQKVINLYPIGDAHLGSPNFHSEGFNKYTRLLESDPNGRMVIVGDLVNNGLKTSKSNTYEETMRPREQKEALYEWMLPLRDKILGGTNGNHEWRSLILGDDCPIYDVMCRLQLEDLYRENMAFMKLRLGEKPNGKPATYSLCVAHGASQAKTNVFGYALEGVDIMVTGHVHKPTSTFPARLVFDPYNNKVVERDFTHIIVPSFESGGYGLRSMYAPQSHTKIPIISIFGHDKEVNVTWK